MISVLAGVLYVIGWYLVYVACYYACVPCNVDPGCPTQRTGVYEMPMRMCQIIHCLYTMLYGFGYVFGVFSLETLQYARLGSTAFLLFDLAYTCVNYNRYKAIANITESYHAKPSRHSSIMSIGHPAGATFHHVVTLLFIYGVCFQGTIAGCLSFFQGELPVLFIHWFWVLCYRGVQKTPFAELISQLMVWTYFVNRVFMFLFIAVFVMLPLVDWYYLPSYLMILLLGVVYAFNTFWFYKLFKQNKEYFPDYHAMCFGRAQV